MDKSEIIRRIEEFAPPELAESWDCSGVLVGTSRQNISKIMLALTVTNDVLSQAFEQNCNMIISHHPLFFVPFEYKNIDIYCAHTNLDKTDGGTTDELIRILGFESSDKSGFVRYVNLEDPIIIEDFIKKLQMISPNLRYVNNFNTKTIQRVGFCSGSGTDFIEEAFLNDADAFVTGDLKFHTALESQIVVFDIGHFESEILALKVLAELFEGKVETVFAEEKSPFISM